MTAFAALVAKDLRLFFADRRAVIMMVVAPIAIASFFGFIFSGEGSDRPASRVAVYVADEDASPISQDLVARLRSDAALAVTPGSLAAAREAVRRGRAAVAIHLPRGFAEQAAAAFFGGGGRPKAALPLLYDPSRATEASMVQGILAGHAMESISREMFSGQTGRDALDRSLATIAQNPDVPADERSALDNLLRGVRGWNDLARSKGTAGGGGGLTIPFEVTREAVTFRRGTPYNSYAHSFAGMGVQFILFLAIEMGVGLLLQRRDGLWKRLRAAPVSKGVLLGSRAASTALLSLFVLGALFLFARVAFGVRVEGSAAGFVAVCVAFSLMTAAFGLLLASAGKTPESTRGLSIVATLLLVMLGGAWVPTFVFPAWLQTLTAVVPTRWAVDGLDATTWRGLGFGAVAWPLAFLLATAIGCAAVAVATFRWDAD
jgi:ABC-2 type transport system permease protein